MAEAVDEVIGTWLRGEQFRSDQSYNFYVNRQKAAYDLFFMIGDVLMNHSTKAYRPVHIGETALVGQPGGASERVGVALCFSSMMDAVLTPVITAYGIMPDQTFDPDNFDPTKHRMLRTLDLPPDALSLPHEGTQREGRPTPENVADVLVFTHLLYEIGR